MSLGLYRDNRKENGNYYSIMGIYWGPKYPNNLGLRTSTGPNLHSMQVLGPVLSPSAHLLHIGKSLNSLKGVIEGLHTGVL